MILHRHSGRAGTGVAVLSVLLLSVSGCARVDDGGVRAYVDEAIDGLSEGYYADSREWYDAIDEELPGLYAAESIPDTYAALRRLTSIAGGKHSFFQTLAEAAGWERPYASGDVPTPMVTYQGAVGTVEIPEFSSAHQDERDEYLGAAAGVFDSRNAQAACGWVIDLRSNRGGDFFTMLAAVSPLLEDGDVEAFRDRDGDATRVSVSGNTVTWGGELGRDGREFGSLPGEPRKLARLPIAIVQSGMTASAAEALIIAFAGQPHVETFGSQSAGLTTMNDGFDLPDGANVTLSFALMEDREGKVYEEGIAPDHPMELYDSSALGAAQEWVMRQCAGP